MENIECYFEIANNIWFFAITFITAYCYYYLAKQFLKEVKLVWLIGVVYFFTMTVLYYIPFWEISNFSAYAFGVISGFIVMFLLERKKAEVKIFLSVTFFSLRWLSLAMEGCIDKMFYHYASHIIGSGHNWKMELSVFIIELVIDLLLSFAFLFCAIWIIQNAYEYKKEELTKKELAVLLVPSLSGVLGYEVMQYYNYVYERDAGKSILDIYSFYDWLCFFNYFFSFAAILVIIVIFQKIKSQQEEDKRNEILSGQLESMKHHIGEIERLYCDMRSLKHDMGNHVMTLENLYGKKEYKEAGKYVAQLKKQLKEAVPEIRSGNPVTDVILTERQKEAKEKGIHYICSFHYPEGTDINAFDISIILNNAITNAIEGAIGCENSYINIMSYLKKNAYMIEIKNSFEGKLVLNEERGMPETSKKDKKKHGFGLENIRRVAQKYFGDIDIELGEKSFRLSIMLMVE